MLCYYWIVVLSLSSPCACTTERNPIDDSKYQLSPIKWNINVAGDGQDILHDNPGQQTLWSLQIANKNLVPMFLPFILPTWIQTCHKLFPWRLSNRIWKGRAESREKRNTSDFTDDLKSDAQPGVAYFSIHMRSIIVDIGFHIHIKLMNKPLINIHRNKNTQPPIFLKNLVSFVGCILLIKSLSCNVAVIIRDAVYFKVFKSISKNLFQVFKEDYMQIPS
jgi:hypothetical protein